jgi:hypothetical protein
MALLLLGVAAGLGVIAGAPGQPARMVIRVATNAVLGAGAFLAWNMVAGPERAVAVNGATVGAVGILGLPGFLLVLVARWWVTLGH